MRRNMKIGLLAYASNTGLGYQTRDFAKNIACEKVLIADLSKLNNMPIYLNGYEKLGKRVGLTDNKSRAHGIPNKKDIEWLLEDIDLVYVCETPLNWNLFTEARRKGIASVLHYNYEFLEYYRNPAYPKPTLLASPSYWYLKETRKEGFAPVEYLPVPIDTKKFETREIKEVKHLTHILGRPAKNDRNGTKIFLEMALKLGKKYKYTIFAQTPREKATERAWLELKPLVKKAKKELGKKFTIEWDTEDNRRLYSKGDIMIMPRRYGGLCLPLWEAMSSGMPVIMPNISPNNKVLPKHWLCDAKKEGTVLTHSEIPIYTADIDSLIEKVLNIEGFIKSDNILTNDLVKPVSWENMKREYLEVFEDLVQKMKTK